MKRTKGIYLALLAVLLSPMAATAMPVTVGANDWMQPLDTINNSWTDINGVCDAMSGICTGMLGTVGLDGWMWASAEEVGDMFRDFPTAHPGGIVTVSEANSTWAPQFLAAFVPTQVTTNWSAVYGFSRTLNQPGVAYYPGVEDHVSGPDYAGSSLRASTGVSTTGIGGWFYQATPPPPPAGVPEPGSLALLTLGLVGMAARRKKKA
jgi:hypothetical protein